MYMLVKHIHLSAVALSVILFVVRFVWAQFNPAFLQRKWVKIAPHIIDTVLLLSAIVLCIMLSQYPFVNDWLTFKVLGVILYIAFGLLALKWGRNFAMRWVGFIGALTWIALTAQVAVTKQPLLF